MSAFQAYSSPSRFHRFSALYLDSLTLGEAAAMHDWPTIAPTGSVVRWEWSSVDFAEGSPESEIQSNEVIPNALDLGPILVAMQAEFGASHRSAIIYLRFSGQAVVVHYHFLKVRFPFPIKRP